MAYAVEARPSLETQEPRTNIPEISEAEIDADLERARSVAGASFKKGGLEYHWDATYSGTMQDRVLHRCQELQASGRAVLLVRHSNGNLTLWIGPASSSQTTAQTAAPERSGTTAPSTATSQVSEPKLAAVSPVENADFLPLKISVLRALLTSYVGPIAGLMCDRLFAQGVSFEAAIEALTQKIPDAGDAKKFSADAHQVPDTVLTRLKDLMVGHLGPAGVAASEETFARSSTLAEAIAALAAQLPHEKNVSDFEKGAKDLLAEYRLAG